MFLWTECKQSMCGQVSKKKKLSESKECNLTTSEVLVSKEPVIDPPDTQVGVLVIIPPCLLAA